MNEPIFDRIMNFLEKFCLYLLGSIVAAFTFWLFCINHVSPNEVGIAYDRTNGKMTIQSVGWHITAPYVKVTTVYSIFWICAIPFYCIINYCSSCYLLLV